jgi:hypothetical protein
MKPTFNTDFEYDEWFEDADNKRVHEDFFGEKVKGGDEDEK